MPDDKTGIPVSVQGGLYALYIPVFNRIKQKNFVAERGMGFSDRKSVGRERVC